MGRFRQKRIIVKVCEEVNVVFWDWNRVYVQEKATNKWYLFHKYHAPLGTYSNSWRPFKRRLMKIQNLTFARCCQLANQYEILGQGSVGEINFKGKAVEIRYPKWSAKGVIK